MHRMPTDAHLADDVDDAAFEDVDFEDEDFDDADFDDLLESDWPQAALDACAPEGAFA